MNKKTLALVALTLLGSAAAGRYPLTVTDDQGRTVRLAREPLRVVSMLPSHTETVVALGAAEKLVGVDEFSNYPASLTARLPKVGNGFQPNIEAIVALRPDLVLVDGSTAARLVGRLEEAGLNVYVGTPGTVPQIFQTINTVGRMLNREAGALALTTRIRRDVNALEAAVRGRPVVSVYYELDPTPYSVGPGSYIGDLLRRARARTIVPAGVGDFPQISPELVIRSRPQAMLGLTLDTARSRPGWAALPAVQSGRVHTFTPEELDALSRPGPRLAQALRALVRVLHPGVLRE